MDLIDITIGEALPEIAERYRVKLGCKDGSGFVFCGDLTEEILSKVNRRELKKEKKYLSDLEKKLEGTLASGGTVQQYATTKFRKEGSCGDAEDFMVFLDKYLKQIERMMSLIESHKERIRTWQRIADRFIVELYPSVAEEKTLIVLIEGDIQGDFWTSEESEAVYGESAEKKEVTT